MSKVTNVNSSLAYEILLYLNSFYIGMFIVCEVAIGILKAYNAPYPENALVTEGGIFGVLCIIEVIRIFLGRKGNLVNRKGVKSRVDIFLRDKAVFVLSKLESRAALRILVKLGIQYSARNVKTLYPCYIEIPVFFSLLLTIPSSIGVCYFLIYQTYILRLEYIWCTVMLLFQALELVFVILYMVTVCKNRQCT